MEQFLIELLVHVLGRLFSHPKRRTTRTQERSDKKSTMPSDHHSAESKSHEPLIGTSAKTQDRPELSESKIIKDFLSLSPDQQNEKLFELAKDDQNRTLIRDLFFALKPALDSDDALAEWLVKIQEKDQKLAGILMWELFIDNYKNYKEVLSSLKISHEQACALHQACLARAQDDISMVGNLVGNGEEIPEEAQKNTKSSKLVSCLKALPAISMAVWVPAITSVVGLPVAIAVTIGAALFYLYQLLSKAPNAVPNAERREALAGNLPEEKARAENIGEHAINYRADMRETNPAKAGEYIESFQRKLSHLTDPEQKIKKAIYSINEIYKGNYREKRSANPPKARVMFHALPETSLKCAVLIQLESKALAACCLKETKGEEREQLLIGMAAYCKENGDNYKPLADIIRKLPMHEQVACICKLPTEVQAQLADKAFGLSIACEMAKGTSVTQAVPSVMSAVDATSKATSSVVLLSEPTEMFAMSPV